VFGKKDERPEKTPEELRVERYADPKADCPMWQAPCKQHGCRFYIKVTGHNPNTGVIEDRWDCALAWLPILTIENSQQQRQTGASTDKVATEIDKFRAQMARQNNQMQQLLLEGSDDDRTTP
jgi:hypothetical protein